MSVTQILVNLCSPDPLVQKPAEATIAAARDSDLAGFLLALIQEVRDDTKPSIARQQAVLLLKNTVALDARSETLKEELDQRWQSIPAEVRASVKAEMVNTLAATDDIVRSLTALCIANIARTELPRNEWTDLLPTLVGVATTGTDANVEAALTTLGYICEESNECEPLGDVLQHHNNEILNAVCKGMTSPNNALRYAAIKALLNALDFVSGNMDVDGERNYLMTVTVDCLKSDDVRVREKAMETLTRIAHMYYSHLPQYITALFDATGHVLRSDRSEVQLQAMQFWSAICEVEVDIDESGGRGGTNFGFAPKAAEPLVPVLCQLLQQQEEGQTEEDWNVSTAASKLLQLLADCTGNAIVAIVMPFVYSKIESQNWRERDAAVVAFGCVLNGPDPKSIEDTVQRALPGLFQYIRDNNEQVSDSAGWALSIVADLFSDVLLEASTLQTLLNILGPFLQSGDERRGYRAVQIIHNLALRYDDDDDSGEQPTNAFSPYFHHLLTALVALFDHRDARLRLAAQEALNVVVGAGAADSCAVLRDLIPAILQRIQGVVSTPNAGASSERQNEIDATMRLFCGAINQICRKLKGNLGGHEDNIMQVLLAVLNSNVATIKDEAFLCIGGLATAMGPAFEHYAQAVLPCLVAGLRNHEDFDECTVVIGAIGDFVGALQDRAAPYCDDFMTVFFEILVNQDVERDLKCTIIECCGDMALHLGSAGFTRYAARMLALLTQLDELARQVDFDHSDSEDIEFVIGLWEAMCHFFSNLLQGYKEDIAFLTTSIPPIVTFVTFVANRTKDLIDDEADLFNAIVSVIGDLANVAGCATRAQVDPLRRAILVQPCYNIVKTCLKHQDEGLQEQATWAQKEMQALERV